MKQKQKHRYNTQSYKDVVWNLETKKGFVLFLVYKHWLPSVRQRIFCFYEIQFVNIRSFIFFIYFTHSADLYFTRIV